MTPKTTQPTPATPPTPSPKRVTPRGVIAGRLFERIRGMRSDCEAEVNASPQQIRAKWASKEKAALEGAELGARELVEKMLKAEAE